MSFIKGHPTYVKTPSLGKHWKLSDESKRRQSECKKGKKLSKKHCKALSFAHIGQKVVHSEETKRKIGLANRFRKRPDIAGKNNWNWQGGITPEIRKIRNSIEIRLWREAIFARDNFTCQKTMEKGVYLIAHHIQSFYKYPELRTSIENGITLSKQAHLDFHNKYGRRNNTKEQLVEFLQQKNV